MGSLYRSQDMTLVRVFLPTDTVKSVLTEVGRLNAIHFRDLNSKVNAFQRNFINEVKRINEVERKLTYFETQLQTIPKYNKPYIHQEQEQIIIEDGEEMMEIDSRDQFNFETLESTEEFFEQLERESQQLFNYQNTLQERNFELVELRHVLLYLSPFFESDLEVHLHEDSTDQLRYVVGSIDRKKVDSYERVLWRTLRGNMFFRNCEIEEDLISPFTGESLEKNAFVVFFQGERVKEKIKKISDAFGCSMFQFPTNQSQRDELIQNTQNHIEELTEVINRSLEARNQLYYPVYRNCEKWKEFLRREKAIFHTMNLFEYDFGRRCLVAEGWCPSNMISEVQAAMRIGSEKGGGRIHPIIETVHTKLKPPTYHKTNEFTKPFQDIVDMYGVARYKEANPGVFTIITFPFLFGVMFGDVGHGLLLLFPALYILFYARFTKSPSPMLKGILEVRWLLFLMAVFAIYCGFMYNEFYSLPMSIFPTNWRYPTPLMAGDIAQQIDPDYCYPFGVDPLWKGSFNELDYYNSLKMKMSILMGVAQMMLGIVISSTNTIYFNQKIDFFFGFVPQLLFLSSIFGYMCVLIVTKWLIQWPDNSAPRLLNLIIEMILTPWTFSPKYEIFAYQHQIQIGLVLLALICVPWMLLPKPIILFIQHRLSRRRNLANMISNDIQLVDMSHEKNEEPEDIGDDNDDDELQQSGHESGFDFGEVVVHQFIHTIEFVLGCISNTASYLRLWALSLAHSELSAVFYERILLKVGLMSGNFALIFACWAVWAALTIGVLLAMESMSALLHALRLHWVEFQNKFYAADGYKFVPFSFEPREEDE